MVRKYIIALLIIFFATGSFANQWHDEADRYWNEAQKYKKARDYKQAIEYLKRAVAAEKRNENPRSDELISQLNEIGQVYNSTGNYEKSLHYYKMMQSACRKYNNADQEALAFNSMGQTYASLNRLEEAMASYQEALTISRKNGYNDKMILVLNNMAFVYRLRKDFDNSRQRYEEALSIAKKSGSTVNVAVLTSNAGTLYFFTGDYDRSLELYTEALDTDRKRGGDEDLSVDLSNIGSVYAAKGRYGEALNYYEKALELDSKYKNEKNMSARFFRIGDIYFRVGDNARAIEFYHKSLEMNMKLNNTVNAALVQNSLGLVFDSMGKYDDAMDYYVKALALNKDIELQENITLRLSDIGLLYETRERYGEAVDYIGKALLRDMMSEKKNRIADNLSNMGRVMVSLKRYDKALDYFRQAMDLYRELGDAVSLADDLKNSGIVYYTMKEYLKAIEYFLQARQILDARVDKKNISIADVRSDVFRWLIASYIKADKPDKAYEVSETFSIHKVYSLASGSGAAQQISSISYDNLRKKLGKNTALVIVANIIWDNPFLIYIDSDTASGYEIDKAAAVQTLYKALGKDIESFIGKKKGDIIFKMSQKSRHDNYYFDFEKIINYYRSLLGKKYISSKEYEVQQSISRILYQFLFKKIENNIAGKDMLVIQTDGVLSTVPLETLVMPDGRFLVEKIGIRYTFSQTCDDYFSGRRYNAGRKAVLLMDGIIPPRRPALKNIESSRHFEIIIDGINRKILSGKNMLEMYGFFGYDTIGGFQSDSSEVLAMKSMRDVDVLSGDQVTESNLMKLSQTGVLGNYRVLHVLSQGIVVPEVPQLSALVVSYIKNEGADKDGILNGRKLSSLKLNADLVNVASISIPAAGYSRGEGIWNLCGSLMIAGSRGVCLSLWDVDGATRSYFMKQVYQAALNQGIPYEKAFTQTKRAFIQGKVDRVTPAPGSDKNGELKLSNPYFWGSFIYYGR